MRHIKKVSVCVPAKAMETSQLLLVIGTVLSGLGGILVAISQSIGGSKAFD